MALIKQDVIDTLERIPVQVAKYLESCYNGMVLAKNNDDEDMFWTFQHKMMGALDCLSMMELINDYESSKLYKFYTDIFES